MIKIKRYYTALRRYKRSKGFGIHSPFAFNFVLKVLRERCPYYAYDNIHAARWQATRLASKKEQRGLISFKNAKMIFRITCYFNPNSILQIGTSHGVLSSAVLNVSTTSHLHTYLGAKYYHKIYQSLTSTVDNRITKYEDINQAINGYFSGLNDGESPFVIINHIDSDTKAILNTAIETINRGGVVIVRNINNNKAINYLWKELKTSMPHGMSFSNFKIGIIVGHDHLPLQHFSLWF